MKLNTKISFFFKIQKRKKNHLKNTRRNRKKLCDYDDPTSEVYTRTKKVFLVERKNFFSVQTR